MKNKEELKQITQFLRDHLLECEPEAGCGRCNELRKHIETLESWNPRPQANEVSEKECDYCNNPEGSIHTICDKCIDNWDDMI